MLYIRAQPDWANDFPDRTGQSNKKNARYSISAKFQNLSTLLKFNGVDYVFTGNKSDKMDAFSFLT